MSAARDPLTRIVESAAGVIVLAVVAGFLGLIAILAVHA